jgi:GNAT superfamily N-acetyltransferase
MSATVRRIVAAGDEYLLAAVGDRPADGVLQLRYRPSVWTDADDAWIEDVFVRESARGAGLGRALVEQAIERARQRGCMRIELDVDEGNAPARALYASLGFSDDLKADVRSLLLGRRLVR